MSLSRAGVVRATQAEAGFLALLLPAGLPLHRGLSATAPPPAAQAWALRLLLTRVLCGMGRKKFSGGWWKSQNRLYIKSFLVWQPVPTAGAWHLFHRCPDALFVLMLGAFCVFVVLLSV